MNFQPPPGASCNPPAKQSELDWLRAALSDDAAALEPIFTVTDGFAAVIRGGEMDLWLYPIRDFHFLDDDRFLIGTDTYGSDLVIDTSVRPPVVELQCAYGGASKERLCSVTEFGEWISHQPPASL